MVFFHLFEEKLSSQSLDSLFAINSSGAEITHNLNWRRSCDGIMMHQISQSVKSIALMLQYFSEHGISKILSDHLLSHKTK